VVEWWSGGVVEWLSGGVVNDEQGGEAFTYLRFEF